MSFFERLSNGWRLGKTSLNVIYNNPTLLAFPLISGAALIMITLSFVGSGYVFVGEDIFAAIDDEAAMTGMNALVYLGMFAFYLITYFVVVFFNVGLVHCVRMVLNGEETNFAEGFNYAKNRVGAILAWAVLAATVGMILKAIQERVGAVGNIITGIIGMIWGIATYFVIPIIAYEDVGPIEAVKRSAAVMKEKWGESIGANFSFGLFFLFGLFLIALPLGFLTGMIIHPLVGVAMGIISILLISVTMTAAEMVFITAAYQHVTEEPVEYFNRSDLDNAFRRK